MKKHLKMSNYNSSKHRKCICHRKFQMSNRDTEKSYLKCRIVDMERKVMCVEFLTLQADTQCRIFTRKTSAGMSDNETRTAGIECRIISIKNRKRMSDNCV